MFRAVIAVAAVLAPSVAIAQASQSSQPLPPAAASTRGAVPASALVLSAGVQTPPDYVIGADDILSVVFWRDKELSTDVAVRPDGKISLPLINDVQAAGLTPEQLRLSLTDAASKFLEDSPVTVVVKAINSRKVFITGMVAKAGPYQLSAATTVLQLIATAGGVLEYAKSDQIVIMRTENGKTVSHKFNYKDVSRGKNLQQNIELKPGDTIVVP
jgi:polysaccharide export outer membrane protein